MTVLFLERKFLHVFSIFGKLAQTDAKRIICNLMFAVKGTHTSPVTLTRGDYPVEQMRC